MKFDYSKCKQYSSYVDISAEDKQWKKHLIRKELKKYGHLDRRSTDKEKSLSRFVNKVSCKLRKNTPKSELWFYNQLEQSSFPKIKGSSNSNKIGHQNVSYNGKIPDIINSEYRFVVEIDGSIHNLDSVKEKDKQKEVFYRNNNYKVFRVKAFCLQSFTLFLLDLVEYLKSNYNLDSTKLHKHEKRATSSTIRVEDIF